MTASGRGTEAVGGWPASGRAGGRRSGQALNSEPDLVGGSTGKLTLFFLRMYHAKVNFVVVVVVLTLCLARCFGGLF